mmetsp:Transcript_119678/g.168424  ORF Transcript_119678/g.168424 Transcript_119678/m.168424 type:complete len:174 (-) Transcript_119678:217-738(-)
MASTTPPLRFTYLDDEIRAHELHLLASTDPDGCVLELKRQTTIHRTAAEDAEQRVRELRHYRGSEIIQVEHLDKLRIAQANKAADTSRAVVGTFQSAIASERRAHAASVKVVSLTRRKKMLEHELQFMQKQRLNNTGQGGGNSLTQVVKVSGLLSRKECQTLKRKSQVVLMSV